MALAHRSPILLLALTLANSPAGGAKPPHVTVISGTRPDGSATTLWLALLRRRLDDREYDSVIRIRRRRTAEEDAWARMIASESRHWSGAADSLTALFDRPVVQTVQVVLGNRGADDAFTHDSLTIGMDLSALQRIYGDASAPENRDRVNRFFRHEFVHTLQKRWLVHHPFVVHSFLDAALFDEWAEGLGNFFSLSRSWRPGAAGPAPEPARILAILEPRFVARMTALACADSAAAPALLKGLSSGPFTEKWGALPVALWLLAEESSDRGALHAFAEAGPPGVWALAERNLPPSLADSLALARHHAAACSTPHH